MQKMYHHNFYLTLLCLILVGVFKKKRGGGTWGHGLDILNEMLDLIETSGLIHDVRGVYIGILGTSADREEAKVSLKHRQKVTVVVESAIADYVEFPALNAMQIYANLTDPRSRLLYLHTKGVRKNGWHADYPAEWRRYMTYFLVENHHVCLSAITSDGQRTSNKVSGYQTCGVLKQQSIYQVRLLCRHIFVGCHFCV